MNLFDDFEIEPEKDKEKFLKQKRNKDDDNINLNINSNDNNILISDQNPDIKIENRLKGLIDDKDLLKGSDEIKLMKIETFDVKGCTHIMLSPKDGDCIKRKFFLLYIFFS